MEHDQYISTVKQSLNERDYIVQEGGYLNSQPIDLLAQQSKFKLTRYSHIKKVFILAQFSSIDIDSFKQFADHCFEYACQSRRLSSILYVRLLPMRENIVCPVATVDELDTETAIEIHKMSPIRKNNGVLFPVVADLRNEQLHFSDEHPWWSMFLYDDAKQLAENTVKFS